MNPQDASSILPPRPASRMPWVIASIAGLLFIIALIFGVSAYSTGQNYKNNADQKAAAAAAAAAKSQSAKDQANFDQQSKSPYKAYTGSATYGSISFQYPKTWSAYVDETGGNEPINGYYYPNQVPGIQSNTAFALRVELVDTAYSDVLNNFQSSIGDGSLKASAFMPPKLKGVANAQPGTLLTGVINKDSQGNNQNGAMVVLKVRDKTLQIYTQSNDYLSDFNNIILPSITYAP